MVSREILRFTSQLFSCFVSLLTDEFGLLDVGGMLDVSIPETFDSLARQVVVVTGPTASGKSRLAIMLAARLEIEILSLDSIAVYRHMDIGTAKPSREDQKLVTHHLLDLADPNTDFSVAPYLALAHQCVAKIRSRGRIPVFVGGTPMFLKGILRGFDPGPPPDWEFRQSVEDDLKRHGVEALRERLCQVDPLSHHRIAPNDTRRMIRALEVAKVTGIPLSHRQVQFDQAIPPSECCAYWMRWPRHELHERINRRVQQMFDAGLVAEVNELLQQYAPLSRTAAQAVGYREIIEGLAEGLSVERQKELVATHTRQLAKRQETWFRSFTELEPVDCCEQSDLSNIADNIADQIRIRFR